MNYCIGVAAVGMQVEGSANLRVRARWVAIAIVLCLLNQIKESVGGWGIIETPIQIIVAHLQQAPHCTFWFKYP